MEENNTNKENITKVEKLSWKSCIAMMLAAFLGGFLAFYFVADQIMERHYKPHRFDPHKFEKRMFDDVERMYHNQHKNFEKMYKDDMNAFKEAFKINKRFEKELFDDMPMFMMDSVKIKTDYDDNEFKVTVSLKAFKGDENKVNYNIKGRKLTVFGNSQIKEKDYEHDVSFSQDFILPKNADIAKVTKTKDGDNVVISVPMKK